MSSKPITGYEVRGGAVVMRTLYATRAEASRRIADAKVVRGFALRWGKIVATATTRRKNGKLRHQEVGGNGHYWEDHIEPFATRAEASKARLKNARDHVRRTKERLAIARRELRRSVQEFNKARRAGK